MISSETSRVRYAGDGFTQVFDVPWHVLDIATGLKVVRRFGTGMEIELALGSDWSVASAFDENGGSIDIGIPLTVGEVLSIARNEAAVQNTSFTESGPFPAAAQELALDRVVALAAASKERWGRALSVRETDGLSGGVFQANSCRITGLADPTDDTDAATKSWVLAQIASPTGWSPDKTVAQWNANALMGYFVSSNAPTDGYVLTWNLTNQRWEPRAPSTVTSLTGTANTWSAAQAFSAATTFSDTVTLNGAGKSLVFGATSQRIKGHFYGTPYANRTIFTPDAANQNCQIGCLPTLAGGEGAWDIFGGTDPDNAPVLHLACNSTNATLQSAHTGAGVTQDFTFYRDSSLAYKISTNGRMQMNGASDNGAQLNVNGTVSRQAGTFRAHRNGSTQTMTNGTFTKVTLTTEDYDQAGWFDLANSRYVPQIAGKYCINFGSGMDAGAVTSGKRLASVLYKNGVAFRLGNNSHASAADALTSIGMATVDANGSTDYFELYVFHNMGADQPINGRATDCFIEGFHIG